MMRGRHSTCRSALKLLAFSTSRCKIYINALLEVRFDRAARRLAAQNRRAYCSGRFVFGTEPLWKEPADVYVRQAPAWIWGRPWVPTQARTRPTRLQVNFPGIAVGGNDVTSSLYGYGGNDYLTAVYGSGGDDFEEGDPPSGTLSLCGGSGNDFLGVDAPYMVAGDNFFETVPTYMYGGSGDDTIQGTKVNYNSDGTFSGGDADFLFGGPGDDTYRLFGGTNAWEKVTIVEKAGEGFDTVVMLDRDLTLPANVEKLVLAASGYYGNGLQGVGNDLDNVISGTAYADKLDGRGGNDRIFGGDNNDLLFGGAGNDSLAGQAGNDTLWGGAGNDHLGGGTGNDMLYGEDGIDVLTGRYGADTLSGGGGNDRFVYEVIDNSKPGAANHDTILDMAGIGGAGGDRIDLHQIDADTTKGGHQAFTFVSPTAVLKAGQLHVVAGGGSDSLVQGEVDGKACVDFEILVQDGLTNPSDWIASDFIL